jgi:outer membrane protein insertion porin family
LAVFGTPGYRHEWERFPQVQWGSGRAARGESAGLALRAFLRYSPSSDVKVDYAAGSWICSAMVFGGLLTVPGLGWAQAGIPASLSDGPTTTQSATPTASGQVEVPQASNDIPPTQAARANAASAKPDPTVRPLTASLTQFAGKPVIEIRYEGVIFDQTDKLLDQLSQKAGKPFDPEMVRQMTRRLFATGRYRNIAVRVESQGAGVDLIFAGVPKFYVGRVEVNGIKSDRLSSLVEYGTQLNPGAPFTNALVTTATEDVKQTLASSGYYQPVIAVKTTRQAVNQQVNVTYTISVGPQARVGAVTLLGSNLGITEQEFLKTSKLRTRFLHHKPKVERETVSDALSDLRTYYQKKDHLEATVSLQKSTYNAANKELDYTFAVDQGPVVKVDVEGAKFSKSRLHLLVPVFEEGTVDVDLLNEGSFNMKDYLQQEGYFDAKVAVKVEDPKGSVRTVLYMVDKGAEHKVVSVNLTGNQYFSTMLLQPGLRVQKGDLYQRSGRYSAQLVQADVSYIQSIYRANGFSNVQVTPEVKDSDDGKVADIRVTYKIEEGAQQKFGTVVLDGAAPGRKDAIEKLLATQSGQPFSLVTLSGDRDTILEYYLSNGFDEARVEVSQKVVKDADRTNVGFNVTEGPQVFVGKVIESGVHYTRQSLVNAQVTVHAGDPLDQSALLETQRNLYNLALFNEVVAAVQNPSGDAEQKNVLLQLTEAKRWDVTYGFGFEAQTGVPSCGQYCTQVGTTAAQEGKAGVSPRVTLDVSRINLRGTDNSLTLHTTYGLLEKVAEITFSDPHFRGAKNFAAQLSGGYSNVQDISTFQSSKLQGDFRVTQKATRKDTFIYDFQYRRISVNADSLAISANLIPLLSEPVRVGGPGITWFHDTRTPSPLDAVKGSYTSVDEFLASHYFGSQAEFNRTDITNSTYYQFGKGRNKYVFARNARFGFINSRGTNPNIGISACAGYLLNLNASCSIVPLPERLYAGGATSDRGYPINGAGPRDLQTGFPVGGSGVFINQLELRLPPPTLPKVGSSVSFVVFLDSGNVFNHVKDVFPSIKNYHQPNEQTCENVSNQVYGNCNFNYYTEAPGIGARYNTPVGPIRLDLAYTLNPPRYPVIPTITNGTYVNGLTPYVGQGGHFQFFFSIGQSF